MGAQEERTDSKTGNLCKISSSSPRPGATLLQESTQRDTQVIPFSQRFNSAGCGTGS